MPVELRMPASELTNLLDEAIDSSTALDSTLGREDVEVSAAAYESWDKRNQIVLDRAFRVTGFLTSGPKNDYVFALGLEYPFGLALAGDDPVDAERLRKDVATKVTRLRTIIDSLDAYGEPAFADNLAVTSQRAQEAASGGALAHAAPEKVFIVHGRNDRIRLEVELLITKAAKQVEAIVLADQMNEGASTLIEKLERHLSPERSAMAVVLLTGDDEGRLVDETELKPRARQNVILELGYAIAALGRSRVVVFHETGVELPTDVSGVAYYPLSGDWKSRLLGELRVAGIEVDPSALLA